MVPLWATTVRCVVMRLQIDSVQGLMTCPGLLVCVGREPFSPLLVDFLRKTSEERLPGLGFRSPPALSPRTPGGPGTRSPLHGARSRGSEGSEGRDSRKNGGWRAANLYRYIIFIYILKNMILENLCGGRRP